MNAIIIDDEKHCTESLAILLNTYCPSVHVQAIVHEAEEAIRTIQQQHPDLIFLDINMPRLTGLQLLEALGKHAPQVIFTTAYDDYAVEAFRVGAVDYLMKPIHQKELIEAVHRAEQRVEDKQVTQLKDTLTRVMQPNLSAKKLPIHHQDGITFIHFDDIIYCKSESNYTQIVTPEGSSMLSKTLKEVEEQLNHPQFLRIHNSYLINLNHMQKYVRGVGGYTVMTGDHHVPVSKSRKQALLQAIDVQL